MNPTKPPAREAGRRPPLRAALPWLAGAMLVGFQVLAPGRELAWTWRLAELPSYPPAAALFNTVLEGSGPGLPDVLWAGFLLAAGVWAAAARGVTHGRLERFRAQSAYLALVGWAVVVTALTLRLVFGRPGPGMVLGEGFSFAAWWRPAGLPLGSEGWWGTFPSLQTALVASAVAWPLAMGRRIPGGGIFAALGVAMLAGVYGLLGVLEQGHWPTDAAAGAALGLGWAWALYGPLLRPHSGAGAETPRGPPFQALQTAGWAAGLGLSCLLGGVGLRLAGSGTPGPGVVMAGGAAAGVVILLKLGQNKSRRSRRNPGK